jgi:hypothetical protein
LFWSQRPGPKQQPAAHTSPAGIHDHIGQKFNPLSRAGTRARQRESPQYLMNSQKVKTLNIRH